MIPGIKAVLCISITGIAAAFYSCNSSVAPPATAAVAPEDTMTLFSPPDTSTIPNTPFGELVRYGRELIVNTAYYIGPEGTVGKFAGNKLNCGNCHLDGGTRPYGFNYFSTHANYPQYRGRENEILSLGQRINNCVERPLNGKALPLNSKEVIAMECYIKWLGSSVPIGERVPGDGALELEYPTRAASSEKGAVLYQKHCASCHQPDGQGLFKPDSSSYMHPPLWGKNSYQSGSSTHRVLKLARFVKGNMPHNIAKWNKPVLTDEEAIDVAAFVNDDRIHPRPGKPKTLTYPDYTRVDVKPIDYDKGPYRDSFSEMQHKFGPYQPIIDYHKANNLPVIF